MGRVVKHVKALPCGEFRHGPCKVAGGGAAHFDIPAPALFKCILDTAHLSPREYNHLHTTLRPGLHQILELQKRLVQRCVYIIVMGNPDCDHI